MRNLLFVIVLIMFGELHAQTKFIESVEKDTGSGLTIGGYGQIDFSQPLEDGKTYNATLDVHRMVLLFGYRFNEKTIFVTELELEHVSEIYVEQAFLQHRVAPWLNVKAGLILVPMGIVNEAHEPPFFNGVERTETDTRIIPTTWREVGAGIAGTFPEVGIGYQIYLLNGFKSYDEVGLLRGSDGLRKGRQKGMESIMNNIAVAARAEVAMLPGLKVGASFYRGLTQSTLFDAVSKSDASGLSKADSSIVGVTMAGADLRYSHPYFTVKGQYVAAFIDNTEAYNPFTGKDLGSFMTGYYAEISSDILPGHLKSNRQLRPFIRFEETDTHARVSGLTLRNGLYKRQVLTLGVGFWLTDGAVVKIDYQWIDNSSEKPVANLLNLGVGVVF